MPLFKNLVPNVRGKLVSNVNMSSSSWFKVGGPFELLFIPEDELDLLNFIKNLDHKIPIFIIGALSNTLIRDGGVKGIGIKLNEKFSNINISNDFIEVGASLLNMKFAKYAQKYNFSGYEFLTGIPGTIGGSIIMNAGCYGREMSDILYEVKIIDRIKGLQNISAKKLKMSYRKTSINSESIIISAKFKYFKENLDYKYKAYIKTERVSSQPVNQLTGGSTFKNPEGYKAWKLIEDAGCRGLTIGGAKISDMHTNFIINYDNATADDIESLGNIVRKKVYDQSGIKLEWEIRKIGFRNKEEL
jgi:UDP-N-acetylmuramate dehydrogenase